MSPSLLVTNTKLDMLVKSNNIPRLNTYLNTVNSKNDFTDTVWYGIVPSLELEPTDKLKVTRARFKEMTRLQNKKETQWSHCRCF